MCELCCRLSQQLAAFGADCVLETLGNLQQLKKNALVQDDALACKAPKITFQDGILNLATQSADQIFHVGSPKLLVLCDGLAIYGADCSNFCVCSWMKRWQALSDSVGVSVSFKDKVVKLVELHRPTLEDLTFGEFSTIFRPPNQFPSFWS